MERQKKLLALLVGLLVLAVGYALWDYPRPEKMPPLPPAPKEEGRRLSRLPAAPAGEKDLRIRFDWLAGAGEFRGVNQDLFGILGELPKPLPATPFPNAETFVQGAERKLPVQKSTPQLKYLGYLQADEKKRFFVTVDDVVFVARQREPFGTKKELEIVRADAGAIHVRRGRGVLEEVPLSESSPLATPGPTPAAAAPGPLPTDFSTPWEEPPPAEQSPPERDEEKPQQQLEIKSGSFDGKTFGIPRTPDGDWITEEKR
ncbi:MAG: hypothetical protein GXY54_03840 [Deltaproteobacteria bacterium]|nr:hypothetical protein [Deltaproteobacteria bacterium]